MNKFSYLHFFLLISLFLINGCSNNISTNVTTLDPFESLNRKVFYFNKKLDEKIINPISKSYAENIPEKARNSIGSHLEWMNLPITIINSTLQLNAENTILTSAKFLLNGLTLGFYDLDNHETKVVKKDFGSTLAKYKVPEGPFLMVPFLGPKTTRAFSGFIVDQQNNSNIISGKIDNISLIEQPIKIVHSREKLSDTIDSIYKSSDPYIKMRSFYLQNRRSIVNSSTINKKLELKKDYEFEKLLQ
ncbi:MAG: VacJ family lipoprotein [Proteobacteria bacterium]|nr:VacJ family lipoprotein [Pseudomonadota bacterium]MDA1136482.1 VacJ family lipoprotein [Pseudomonadota bacterium]